MAIDYYLIENYKDFILIAVCVLAGTLGRLCQKPICSWQTIIRQFLSTIAIVIIVYNTTIELEKHKTYIIAVIAGWIGEKYIKDISKRLRIC